MGKRKAAPRRVSAAEAVKLSFEVNTKDLSRSTGEGKTQTANRKEFKSHKKRKTDLFCSHLPKPLDLVHSIAHFTLSCGTVSEENQQIIRSQHFSIGYSLVSSSDAENPVFIVSLSTIQTGEEILEVTICPEKISSVFSSFHDPITIPDSNTIKALASCMVAPVPQLYLHFTFTSESLETLLLRIDICISDQSFPSETFDTTGSFEKPEQRNMREIFAWLFPGSTDALILSNINLSKGEQEFNPLLFYKRIAPTGNENAVFHSPDILNVKLRNYQRRAVNWMLQREKQGKKTQGNPLWKSIRTAEFSFYYNPYSGLLSKKQPKIIFDVPGGILADEMGLGKSIELLACILSNQNHNLLKQQMKFYDDKKISIMDSQTGIDEMNEDSCKVKCFCRPVVSSESSMTRKLVKCVNCLTWQHTECVGYSEENKEEEKKYFCPDCWFCCDQKLPSNTTLIICPTAIIQQWRHEIVRRTSLTALKILIYEGITTPNRINQLQGNKTNKTQSTASYILLDKKISKNSSDSVKIVLPNHLTKYDIVLTTYDTLRGDLNHTKQRNSNLSKQKRSNRQQRYHSLPTPLTGVSWWRICLDEAQMVSSSTAKAACMALQLKSQYRWCISGTPIQRKGLDDLQGLFMFLKLPILGEPYKFRKFIQQPMEYKELRPIALQRLCELTKPIIWRSSKENVKDELCIPPQSEKIHFLKFSPVESHFYKKQHQACSEATETAMIRSRENKLTQKQMSSLLNSLLRLRQACCHPQIGNHSTGIQIQRTPLTMEQLLDQLILKAKIECEEAQRQWICANCALCALYIIDSIRRKDSQRMTEAAASYREMIRVTNENSNSFDVDAIQLIHLYHNLSAVLGFVPNDQAGIFAKVIHKSQGHSLIDASLGDTINSLRDKYTLKNKEQVLSASLAFQETHQKLENLISDSLLVGNGSVWWDVLFSETPIKDNGHEIIEWLRSGLIEAPGRQANYNNQNIGIAGLASRFYALSQLQFVIKAEVQNVHHIRAELLEKMKASEPASENKILNKQVSDLISCSCRTSGLNHTYQTCHSCSSFQTLVKLESSLYYDSTTSEKTNSKGTDGLSRTKHDGDLLILLQLLLRILPRYISQSKNIILKQITNEIEILKFLRKELTKLRQLWEAQRNYLLSLDVVQQATSRIRLKFDGEEVHESEKHYKIDSYEIIPLIQKYTGERNTSWMLLTQRKGQLKYLSNLERKRKIPNENFATSEECVICREPMGDHMVVLACGHEFCGGCITSLIVRSHGTLKCPTCRTRMNSDEIAYISDLPVETIRENNEESQGKRENVTELVDSSGNEIQEISRIPVVGSWGTKIESVVRELLRIKQREPCEKSIVFSQWSEVLELLHCALNENNITSALLGANRKKQQSVLHSYRFLSTISVLLLPLKKGANGLNLTEAKNVFLVEPLLNPGAEAQAIGRIHRIGQTKATTIHRFVILNSVEEKLHEINLRRKKRQLEECTTQWKVNKSEKDCMTTSDLCELFGISQNEEEEKGELLVDETPVRFSQPIVDQFWNTKVEWDGKIVTRHCVAQQLEKRQSLRMLNSSSASAPKLCNLYSIHLPNTIAKAVLKLKQACEIENSASLAE